MRLVGVPPGQGMRRLVAIRQIGLIEKTFWRWQKE